MHASAVPARGASQLFQPKLAPRPPSGAGSKSISSQRDGRRRRSRDRRSGDRTRSATGFAAEAPDLVGPGAPPNGLSAGSCTARSAAGGPDRRILPSRLARSWAVAPSPGHHRRSRCRGSRGSELQLAAVVGRRFECSIFSTGRLVVGHTEPLMAVYSSICRSPSGRCRRRRGGPSSRSRARARWRQAALTVVSRPSC